jgi:ubiquinol-cytochrome c reductase cytochrome c subunit
MTATHADRRRVPRVALVLFALVTTGVLWSVLAPTSRANSTDASVNAVAAGHQLFLEGCASCHGLAAQGALNAPSLIGVGGAAVDFQVSTGRMPLAEPAAQAPVHRQFYSPVQISELAAYVASLAPGPQVPSQAQIAAVAGADVGVGGDLFRANCAQCHNASGAGGALVGGAYAPTLRGANARQILEAMETGPENMPVFGPEQLTMAQKQEVAAYIIAIRHTGNQGGDSLGRIGPVSEGAVAWILGLGACVLFTLWIGARNR